MIACRGMCGAKVEDEDAATRAGWDYLSITAGYRCGTCGLALREAAKLPGTPDATVDTIAPHSRGAIKKETASTILPPTVKRFIQ